MLYLIRSYGPDNKSILKVGFTDNPELRLGSYFYHNPYSEVLETKEGDEMHESLLHLYLNSLGHSFQINGKLDEWYVDSLEVIEIFKLSLNDLKRTIWDSRDEVFNNNKFIRNSHQYRLFSFLYESYKEGFSGEEFIISETGAVLRNNLYRDIDGVFWKIYKKYDKE